MAFRQQIRLTAPVLTSFEIEPTSPQRGTVIWMHGLGASCHDFDEVVPMLKAPNLRFVFPAAPVRPVTLNGGMPMPAWYDIVSLQEPPFRENENHVRAASQQLTELIEREGKRGVSPAQITLIGFSQGGAMALHLGLRHPETLCGVAVLSAYLLVPQLFEQERVAAQHKTPIFFGHGSQDEVVPASLGQVAIDRVVSAGYCVEQHRYPMGHSLCLEEIDDLRQWLTARYTSPEHQPG